MSEIIELYEKELIEIYNKEQLIALRDTDHTYKGRNVLEIAGISNNSTLLIENFNSIKNLWDIINCNSDLRHFTALLFFYRPYINNPLNEKAVINENFSYYTYFQNLPDRRFSQFASICFEKLYNYCDRIGDLLAYHNPSFFQSKKDRIYFSSVIDKLDKSKLFLSSYNFSKILDYRNKIYTEINSHRKDIVHYYQFETNYRFNFTINSTNETEIFKLWEHKKNLPSYFKAQLDKSNELYLTVIDFIKEMHLL